MTYNPAGDLYLRLGVAHDASFTVIKTAYRVQILKVHPDIVGAAGTGETQRLNEAWAVLGDEPKRAAYDAARKQHVERQARPSAPPRSAQPPRPEPRPQRGRRYRGPRSRRTTAPPPPKAEPRARRPPNASEWSKWSDHIRPHPTKPGYVQVDQEAIAEAVTILVDLVEKWLKRRRNPG